MENKEDRVSFFFTAFSLNAGQAEFQNICLNRPICYLLAPSGMGTKCTYLFLIHSAVYVAFHGALSLSDISPVWFLALGK